MTAVNGQDVTIRIWTELRANLHRFIARRTRDEADAEDILQDVFFKIHRGIDRLDNTSRLHSWVYQITRNAIVDHHRRRKPEISLDAFDAFDIAEEKAPEAEIEREEILSCLTPMIDRLPEHYQSALKLADISGIPQTEMATQLNISVSGAKSRVQRARGKMKEMLSDCCQFEFDRFGRAVGMNRKNCSSC